MNNSAYILFIGLSIASEYIKDFMVKYISDLVDKPLKNLNRNNAFL